jgi:aldehyde:ferredoxin oxidoreductase
MNKFIEVNLEKCTACRLCEFACSTHHFKEINPAKSRIKVSIVSKDFFYYPNVCQQCGKAPCVAACPQDEALIRNEKTGAIEVNPDECIGCRMCNDMGMDTISAGVTVGCAMELFERGFLPEKDVGYALKFGDDEALLDLVQKMATREDFGWILGEGSYRLGDRFGHPELSMTVKKQELPNYDPRGVKGQGLAFVTNNRGADHCRAEVNCSEIYETTMLGYWSPDKDVDRHAIKGKAKMTKHYQDYCAWAYDSLGYCYFLLMDTTEQDVVDLLESATGIDFGGVAALNKIGERIFTLERLFNLKAGMSAKDDTLPKRFLKEPMPEGPSKGQVFEQDQILPEYYKLRGWDENGVPQPEKLMELNIKL